jgi:predicted hotdog family 3-hydroxylacyl-ACP dehydratase
VLFFYAKNYAARFKTQGQESIKSRHAFQCFLLRIFPIVTATHYSIEDLLPHRNGMLLIEEIQEGDAKVAVSSAVVNKNWPMCDGRRVNALVLIEVAAQTAGICAGLARILERGLDSDKKSWLVGIKRSRFFVDFLALNDKIITRAENSYEYEGYRQITSTARVGSTVVAEVELQAIQAE